MDSSNLKVFRYLQWATCFVFAGRAWQYIFFDAPYRVLLWDEDLMKGITEKLSGRTWHDFITDVHTDDQIQLLIVGTGCFFVLCTILALLLPRFMDKTGNWSLLIYRLMNIVLLIGALQLALLAFLYCKDNFFSAGQFFEYTLQFSAPLFLLYFAWRKDYTLFLDKWAKITISLTFICHGLYSLGYYPTPGNYPEMIMNILSISEQSAHLFLKIAGVLDFVVGVGVFIPGRIGWIVLAYAVVWGFLTSIARIWGHFYWEYAGHSLKQWIYQAVYRFPHFLVPAAVYIGSRSLYYKKLNL